MATEPIRAVLFDMGGTLESLYSDEGIRQRGTRELIEFLRAQGMEPGLSLAELQSAVVSGMEEYRAWREGSELELSPERVWTEFIFPDRRLPKEQLAALAEDLATFYDRRFLVRTLRPEVPAVLEELSTRGFRLGVISNVLSRTLVPSCLAEYGIARYFQHVVTSARFGWRKPNRRIFDEGARLMDQPPASCAYVGDTLSRDVIGARRAGYGLAIQIRSFLTERSDQGIVDVAPDAAIRDLMEVVALVSQVGVGAVHG